MTGPVLPEGEYLSSSADTARYQESFFASRALRLAADDGIRGITTFCDPSGFWQPATRSLVHRGHYGCVYQALNMTYLGRSRAAWKLYLPDGIEISRRALRIGRTRAERTRTVLAGAELPYPKHDPEPC